MDDAEKTKRLLEIKAFLEKKTEEAQRELEKLQELRKFVESALIERGFRKAELAQKTSTETTPTQPETMLETPIKTVAGEELATIYEDGGVLKVVIRDDKSFNINTPPFMQFLVDRVLLKMQEKDRELARAGEIMPEEILSYNIARDGDNIKEITIRNVAEERVRELKSSIRWTLEKMHEKTGQK